MHYNFFVFSFLEKLAMSPLPRTYNAWNNSVNLNEKATIELFSCLHPRSSTPIPLGLRQNPLGLHTLYYLEFASIYLDVEKYFTLSCNSSHLASPILN